MERLTQKLTMIGEHTFHPPFEWITLQAKL